MTISWVNRIPIHLLQMVLLTILILQSVHLTLIFLVDDIEYGVLLILRLLTKHNLVLCGFLLGPNN